MLPHVVWHGLNSIVGDDLVYHPRHRSEEHVEGSFGWHGFHHDDVHFGRVTVDSDSSQGCECVNHVGRPFVSRMEHDGLSFVNRHVIAALLFPDCHAASLREVEAELFVGHEAPLAPVSEHNGVGICFLEL